MSEILTPLNEKFYPVRERDKMRNDDGSLPRGHANGDCICVGVGGGGSLFLHAGRGDQTGIELERVYGPHLAEGLTLFHDSNPAHNRVVRRRGLVDARVVGAVEDDRPDDENALVPVDRRCDTVQRWLDSHRGFDRANLQDWLNLLWVAENVGEDPLEQVDFILDRAVSTKARTRFREMFGGSGNYMLTMGLHLQVHPQFCCSLLKTTVTKAYRTFKQKHYPNANTKQVDLDKNGINELLVHDGYNYVAVYSYNKNTKKVVKLARVRPGKGYGIPIRYSAKKHMFVLQSASTGGSDTKFYKVSGTKATLKATYKIRINKSWSNGEMTTNPAWYVMGKKVSSATYTNKLNAALKGYGTLKSPAVPW